MMKPKVTREGAWEVIRGINRLLPLVCILVLFWANIHRQRVMMQQQQTLTRLYSTVMRQQSIIERQDQILTDLTRRCGLEPEDSRPKAASWLAKAGSLWRNPWLILDHSAAKVFHINSH